MSIDIRPVVAADHEAWLPLWQGYQRFYMTEIPADTSAVTWQRFLDPAEPMGAALAWQGDQAIGLVHWVIHRSTWTTGDYCYLQDLFVADDLRGDGIGRCTLVVRRRLGTTDNNNTTTNMTINTTTTRQKLQMNVAAVVLVPSE